jgi:hypothetical protein
VIETQHTGSRTGGEPKAGESSDEVSEYDSIDELEALEDSLMTSTLMADVADARKSRKPSESSAKSVKNFFDVEDHGPAECESGKRHSECRKVISRIAPSSCKNSQIE